MKAPSYLLINPMGKVPALKHGDVVVTEGGAICAYLADAFPDAGLAPPPSDPRRAAYYRWLFFAAGPVEHAVTNKSLSFETPEGRQGMVGYGSFEQTIDALEGAVSVSDHIVGDQFTAADVYVGSQIGWGLIFGTMPKRPAFEAYWGRISARPAYLRAKVLDDASVAEQQAAAT